MLNNVFKAKIYTHTRVTLHNGRVVPDERSFSVKILSLFSKVY